MNKKTSISIIVILIIVLILFLILYQAICPTNYNNLSGDHIWLSASTIKFTNNWLKEGAMNLNFTMYESPSSIEFEDMNSRDPYISYPSGTILLPYVIAKISSQDSITINFIKHVDKLIYFVSVLSLAILFYIIIKYIFKINNVIINLLIPIFLSIFWMLLPNNLYYLKNIFFSDQLIIPIVILFLITELLKPYILKNTSKLIKIIYYIFRYIIIFYGIIVDYYFWVVLFIAFCVNSSNIIFNKTIKNKFKTLFLKSIDYIVPFILGVSLFILQVTKINNWYNILLNKAATRINGSYIDHNLNHDILHNIAQAYSKAGFFIIFSIVLLAILITIVSIVKYFKNKNDDIFSPISQLAILIYVPPILQILIFRNHSAIHEFSILKLGLPFVFSILLLSYIIYLFFKKYRPQINIIIYLIINLIIAVSIFIICNFWNNIPLYYFSRYNENSNYELENILKENANYENVYISYTYEIPSNPPAQLSVSNKRVYRIELGQNETSLFPNLDKNAIIFFIIDKNNIGKSIDILNIEKQIIENYQLIHESKNYLIFKRSN